MSHFFANFALVKQMTIMGTDNWTSKNKEYDEPGKQNDLDG